MTDLFTFNAWTISLLTAFAACLLSFNWGMYHFFTEPSGSNSGIDTIKLLGTTLGCISLSGIPLFGIASVIGGLTALLLCAASLALFWWAIHTNRRQPLSFAFSEDEPRHLVRSGPYRWIRHPFYSAYLLAWLTVPIATLQPLMLMPLLAMGAIYVSAARVEEKKFEASGLRDAYQHYKSGTGRFLPRWRFFVGSRSPRNAVRIHAENRDASDGFHYSQSSLQKAGATKAHRSRNSL